MKINELMIGDFVTFKDYQEDKAPFGIKIIALGYQGRGEENEALVCIDGAKANDIIEIDDEIVGIPLTPKILEKNGFKSWEHGYIWKERIGMGGQTTSASSPIEIIIYEGGHTVIMNPHEGKDFQGSTDNVHELQHALRLCGIKKEIMV